MESQIRNIKEKYWKGESTIEEERILKDFFDAEETSDIESSYFEHLRQKSLIKPKVKFHIPPHRLKLPVWLSIAATVAMLFGSVYIFQTKSKKNEFVVIDPKEAYEITQNALKTISSGMNKGVSYADNITLFNKAQKIISHE